MARLPNGFSRIFSMGHPQYFCRIFKSLRWAFQNCSYMSKRSIFWGTYALLKFDYEKRKFDLFNGIPQNFVFHRQTSKVHSFHKRWTFWTNDTKYGAIDAEFSKHDHLLWYRGKKGQPLNLNASFLADPCFW